MNRWMLLNDDERLLIKERRQGGWFWTQLEGLRKFVDAEVKKASGDGSLSHLTTGLMTLMYGRKVQFRLVEGGIVDLLCGDNPLLARLKKVRK